MFAGSSPEAAKLAGQDGPQARQAPQEISGTNGTARLVIKHIKTSYSKKIPLHVKSNDDHFGSVWGER